ncbi:hypothetical protein LAUMK7_05280 [Mycobacterium kansasii]|nr:hypothetical protein LAUMK7_05280 [Mycobacterium kansasii]VBA31806.1 hypothetical protein LAUMK35_05110 [Mycobacterium pseudokansasii]VBA33582.1 hypothetical protein LAUMK21_05069 [Mycobacterium pseudokansasii]
MQQTNCARPNSGAAPTFEFAAARKYRRVVILGDRQAAARHVGTEASVDWAPLAVPVRLRCEHPRGTRIGTERTGAQSWTCN